MNFYIKTVLIMVLTCVLSLGIVKFAKAEYPKCDLYKPYRCVPAYGNKVVCGCGY